MNATVIIPAYNPDHCLINIVNRVWNLGNQVIVVDDGSDIKKQNIFHKISEMAIVIHHEKNLGKGAAVKTALNYIKENIWDCDVVGVMDADGQHLPEDMEKLLRKANQKQESMVLGVRNVGKDMPLKSRIGNKLTRSIFFMVSGAYVADTQTGLRAFSRGMIDRLLNVKGTRYEYEINVLFYCVKEEIPIVELPVQTIYHNKQNSCSHFHPIIDSLRIYNDIIKFFLSSLSSFFLDYLVFCILMFQFPTGTVFVLIANILARVVSGAYNYFINCKFVFHKGVQTKTALQYLLLALGVFVLNNLILQLYSGIFGIQIYVAKILTEVSLFIISFLVQQMFIFKRKYRKKETYETKRS